MGGVPHSLSFNEFQKDYFTDFISSQYFLVFLTIGYYALITLHLLKFVS